MHLLRIAPDLRTRKLKFWWNIKKICWWSATAANLRKPAIFNAQKRTAYWQQISKLSKQRCLTSWKPWNNLLSRLMNRKLKWRNWRHSRNHQATATQTKSARRRLAEGPLIILPNSHWESESRASRNTWWYNRLAPRWQEECSQHNGSARRWSKVNQVDQTWSKRPDERAAHHHNQHW